MRTAPPTAVLTTTAALLTALVAGGCTSVHESVAALRWQDHWGDRGGPVAERDYAQCERLVEQRRALIASCMAARGWTSPP